MEKQWSLKLSVVMGAFMAYLLTNASLMVMGIYMTHLGEQFDVGSALLGWICSLGLATMCIAGPLSSVIVNKFGYRWVVMAGGTLQASGMILTYFANSATWLFISLGVIPGIGSSLVYVSLPIVIASHFTKYCTTMLGVALTGIATGIFVLPSVINALITKYGWRGAVLIEGALIFNTVAIGALFRQVPSKTQKNSKQMVPKYENKTQNNFQIKKPINASNVITRPDAESPGGSSKWYLSHILLLMNTPSTVPVYFASFFVNIAFTAAITHNSNQIVQSGYSETQAALSLSLMGVGSLLGRFTLGFVVDVLKIAPTTVYELTLLFAAASTFLNPIINVYSGFVVSAFGVGFSSGILYTAIFVILLQMVGKQQLASALGIELFVDCFGIMFGGYLAGIIRDMTGNYTIGFYIFGATYILGALVFFPVLLIEKRKQKMWTQITNVDRDTKLQPPKQI